jgi:hypothetical protein
MGELVSRDNAEHPSIECILLEKQSSSSQDKFSRGQPEAGSQGLSQSWNKFKVEIDL